MPPVRLPERESPSVNLPVRRLMTPRVRVPVTISANLRDSRLATPRLWRSLDRPREVRLRLGRHQLDLLRLEVCQHQLPRKARKPDIRRRRLLGLPARMCLALACHRQALEVMCPPGAVSHLEVAEEVVGERPFHRATCLAHQCHQLFLQPDLAAASRPDLVQRAHPRQERRHRWYRSPSTLPPDQRLTTRRNGRRWLRTS
jgi:hypothetical protein